MIVPGEMRRAVYEPLPGGDQDVWHYGGLIGGGRRACAGQYNQPARGRTSIGGRVTLLSMTDQRNAESETPAKWRLLPPRVRLEDTVAEQPQIRAVNPLPDQKETEIESIR